MASNFRQSNSDGKNGYERQNNSDKNFIKKEYSSPNYITHPSNKNLERQAIKKTQPIDSRSNSHYYRPLSNPSPNTISVQKSSNSFPTLSSSQQFTEINAPPNTLSSQKLKKLEYKKRSATDHPTSTSSTTVKKEIDTNSDIQKYNESLDTSSFPLLEVESNSLIKFETDDPLSFYLEENTYEVEIVLAKRDNVSQGVTEYLVKWKNYSSEENIWMARQSLSCSELIRVYNDSSKIFPSDSITTTPYDPSGYKNNELTRNLSYLPTNIYEFIKMVNISGGPFISIANIEDEEGPPLDFQYITNLVYAENVVKPDEGRMVGCNCYSGCKPNSKCSCRNQLPYPYNANGLLNLELGYPIYECNANCQCPPSCLNRVTQRGTSARLQIFKTKHKGWGVRALNKLKKGTFIGVYLGEIITNDEAEKRGEVYDSKGNSYLFDLDYISGPDYDCEYVIDAFKYGNFSHFFNHSCDPNITVYPVFNGHQNTEIYKLAFFTSVDVKKNEELCFDYSLNHEADPSNEVNTNVDDEHFRIRNEKYKCYCGSKKCRGYVHIF